MRQKVKTGEKIFIILYFV